MKVTRKRRRTTTASSAPKARVTPAASMKAIIKATIPGWLSSCMQQRYAPRQWAAHTEVRFNVARQRRRMDLVLVVRWSLKRPKDVIGIEIKSTLKDFESDQKWSSYLPFCHYFCFACPAGKPALLEAIKKGVPASVGILVVHVDRSIVQIARLPQRLPGVCVIQLYETLYERAMFESGSDESVLSPPLDR